MKQNFLICTLLIASSALFAQKPLIVEESARTFSKGSLTAYSATIPQTTLKDAEKDWMKYMATGSKSKTALVNGEYVLLGAVNKNVSPNPFNVYSKLLETTEGVNLTVWLTENDTVFISKEISADKALAAEKYVRDFVLQEYQETVKAELKAENDKLEALGKEQDNLVKAEEKSAKKISEAQRSIQKSKDMINTNNADLQNLAYKISSQKGMVERTASDQNANKGAKQTLKELENEKKKLQKGIETQNKNIDSMNKQIRDEERNLAEGKEQQKSKIAEIEKQKQVVQTVQTKLENIK